MTDSASPARLMHRTGDEEGLKRLLAHLGPPTEEGLRELRAYVRRHYGEELCRTHLGLEVEDVGFSDVGSGEEVPRG